MIIAKIENTDRLVNRKQKYTNICVHYCFEKISHQNVYALVLDKTD